jgi:hypothetical protein
MKIISSSENYHPHSGSRHFFVVMDELLGLASVIIPEIVLHEALVVIPCSPKVLREWLLIHHKAYAPYYVTVWAKLHDSSKIPEMNDMERRVVCQHFSQKYDKKHPRPFRDYFLEGVATLASRRSDILIFHTK